MPSFHRQEESADVRRSQTQGLLVITASTVRSTIGLTLLEAGALGPGDYECDISTHDWQDIDVHLKPSAVTGDFAPTLTALYWDRIGHKGTPDTGSNFAAGTPETLSLTGLKGVQRCRLFFTVPGGGSVEFVNTPGSNPAAIAEYNGL